MDLGILNKKFKDTFGVEATIIRAPGRVNIIGEHTDYNNGLVLPFPISQAIYFACSLRSDSTFHIHVGDLDKEVVINLDQLDQLPDWARYFASALKVLIEDQHDFKGLNIFTLGDIPFGAGISSSSALTCGFLYSIIQLNKLDISKREIVFLSSRAENSTGVNGGKMDQFAICMGQENKALRIDCIDYSYQLVDNALPNTKWILFNTNVEHNLAHTEYNDRRQDCESAIKKIHKKYKKIQSVRDLNLDTLNNCIHLISKKEYSRLCHVVEENARVEQMIEALKNENADAAGALLYESHNSLSALYEVSCEELDYIVAHLKNEDNCIGARMMGGGFGGCVIALVKEKNDDFKSLRRNYRRNFDLDMGLIHVKSDDGVNIVQ